MGKQLIYYFFIGIFFVIYFKLFRFLYVRIGMMFDSSYVNILVMLQIFITIVILIPASVATTRKVFDIIKSD
ncbi:hypothetical protein [Bacillus sp. FJAT-27245]|uniref:hypothetical protein n=1 Tax=Bacillus sp. FJAT-27245 TaxID=1684144 RepID=UPI0006A7B916|nr:hypothetical protein [Bacillus sp. FJAT-27245]